VPCVPRIIKESSVTVRDNNLPRVIVLPRGNSESVTTLLLRDVDLEAAGINGLEDMSDS
jgi:hypothetical protein